MTARAHRLAAHVWDACPGQRAESQLSRNSPAGVVGRDQTDSTVAKFGRQHQKLGPAPAVRHWRSCKILQVPTHPASNKILRIATDVVIIRRRLLMGGCRARGAAACTDEYKASPEFEDRSRYVLAVPNPQKYVPGAEMDRSGPFSLQRDRERALYHFRHLGCCCMFMSHFRPGSACPSCGINFHQHHILERAWQSSGVNKPPSGFQMVN